MTSLHGPLDGAIAALPYIGQRTALSGKGFEMYMFLRDASGKKGFGCSVSERWAAGERRNLTRIFDAIRNRDPRYSACGYDPETVEMVEEKDSLGDGPETTFILTASEAREHDAMSLDDIADALGL